MATTAYGVNDALAVKLWAKELAVEALKYTPIAPLIGTSPDSIIHLKTETSKQAGDKITYGLVAQLTGDGVTEGQILEGNEESLTTFSDSVVINELAHAVRMKSKRRIDVQRVPFDIRETAKARLRDWYAKRLSVSAFNQLCGYTPETRTIYTGNQAVIAPSTGRKVFATGSADESLGNSNLMTLKLLDYAKEVARTSTTPIRPIMIGGEEKYVAYLHPYQVVDLRTDASTAGNWFDITAKAIQGGQVSKNPIYTGAYH